MVLKLKDSKKVEKKKKKRTLQELRKCIAENKLLPDDPVKFVRSLREEY